MTPLTALITYRCQMASRPLIMSSQTRQVVIAAVLSQTSMVRFLLSRSPATPANTLRSTYGV